MVAKGSLRCLLLLYSCLKNLQTVEAAEGFANVAEYFVVAAEGPVGWPEFHFEKHLVAAKRGVLEVLEAVEAVEEVL
jgi:hypothetical protein